VAAESCNRALAIRENVDVPIPIASVHILGHAAFMAYTSVWNIVACCPRLKLALGIEPGTSGSVARNSDHQNTEVVLRYVSVQ
jgi:hypothetical protein